MTPIMVTAGDVEGRGHHSPHPTGARQGRQGRQAAGRREEWTKTYTITLSSTNLSQKIRGNTVPARRCVLPPRFHPRLSCPAEWQYLTVVTVVTVHPDAATTSHATQPYINPRPVSLKTRLLSTPPRLFAHWDAVSC